MVSNRRDSRGCSFLAAFFLVATCPLQLSVLLCLEKVTLDEVIEWNIRAAPSVVQSLALNGRACRSFGARNMLRTECPRQNVLSNILPVECCRSRTSLERTKCITDTPGHHDTRQNQNRFHVHAPQQHLTTGDGYSPEHSPWGWIT